MIGWMLFSFVLEEYGLMHLKNREKMLRRLTRGYNIQPLLVLVNTLVPSTARRDQKYKGRDFDTWTPLVRLCDIAVTDPKPARDLCKWAENVSQNKDAITNLLTVWNGNHRMLQELVQMSPALQVGEGEQMLELSSHLQRMALIGLDALNKAGTPKTWNVWAEVLRAKPHYHDLHVESAIPDCMQKLLQNIP